MTAPQYRFRWTCSYMGTVEYEVIGDGPSYRVEIRRSVCDYQRKIYNGDEAEWQRDVVAAIDLLRRRTFSERPIPADVTAAFNVWLQANHAEQVCQIKAAPERYGELATDDPILAAPRQAKGAHYVIGQGWILD